MVTGRRRRAWADVRYSDRVVNSSGEASDNILALLSPTETKPVSRILIQCHVGVSPTSEAEFHQVIDRSIAVISKEAFDLSTFPDADAVADYPQQGWVYIATLPVIQSLSGSSLYRLDAEFKADVRGQRKVDRGVLYAQFTNNNVSGTATNLVITGRIRALCLT